MQSILIDCKMLNCNKHVPHSMKEKSTIFVYVFTYVCCLRFTIDISNLIESNACFFIYLFLFISIYFARVFIILNKTFQTLIKRHSLFCRDINSSVRIKHRDRDFFEIFQFIDHCVSNQFLRYTCFDTIAMHVSLCSRSA